MSIEAMKAAFALQDISPTDTLVLVALANFADELWQCYPGKGTLITMTKLSPRAVTLSMRRLESLGYLTTEEQRRENGSRTTNRYVLHLGEGGAFAAPSNAPPPWRQVGEGGQRGAPPEPSLNHHIEESLLQTRDPFDDWWAIYPRKEAKVLARRAWQKAIPKINKIGLRELMHRTHIFADHVVEKDKEHIPHPATWLNNERWNDELEDRKNGNSARAPGRADPAAQRNQARVDSMVEGARIAADLVKRRRWSFD